MEVQYIRILFCLVLIFFVFGNIPFHHLLFLIENTIHNKILSIETITLAVENVRCPPNQAYTTECNNSCLHPRCLKFDGSACPDKRLVRYACYPGCVCAEGYAQKRINECVPIDSECCGGLGEWWATQNFS